MSTAKPIPKPTPETLPFWEGCKAQELRLQHCQTCGHVQFYPRKLCSKCFATEVVWKTASGKGKVTTWSEVKVPGAPGFEEEVPFISALVELDEGPTMLSVIRRCDNQNMDFDMPVQVTFEQRSDDIFIPYFEPAE